MTEVKIENPNWVTLIHQHEQRPRIKAGSIISSNWELSQESTVGKAK